ncbi:MAG: SseB family protein [Clostridiales bacterium]|nr:SseB family protein [Clostridiales bacterium]
MNKSSDQKVRNPQLVMAMRAVNNSNTASSRSRMAAELMNARLLSPIQSETVLMEKSGPSHRIRFEDITNTSGEKFYLAFTDMEEYDKWNQDGTHDRALIMTMEDFGHILIRTVNDLKGFVINPCGENISISKDLLLSLLKQREMRQMQEKQGN